MSLPVIRAVASADASEREFWQRTIGRGDQADGDLDTAIELMRRHGSLESTRATALHHAARARSALEGFQPGVIQETLADLADFVVARIV